MSAVASAALPGYLRGAPGRGRQLPALLLIVVLHALALLLLLRMREAPSPQPAPTLMVSLISAAPPEVPPPPPPAQRKPLPRPQLIAAPQAAPADMVAPPMEESPPPPAPTVPEPPAAPAVIPPSFVAAYLNNPAPSYPSLSIRLREQGTVLLLVLVSAEGRAGQVQVEQSSGFARLDAAAVDVVRQRWRFVPARQGEQAVSAWVRIPLSFELKKHE